MKRNPVVFTLLLFTVSLTSNAQFADSMDQEFGVQGVLVKTFETDVTPIQVIALENDELLVLSRANFGNDYLTMAKFDANGQNLVPGYGIFNGFSQFGNSFGGLTPSIRPTDMALLEDGSVIICGTGFNNSTSSFQLIALKLTAQGTIDQQFGTNGYTEIPILNFQNQGVNSTGSDIALGQDGSVFIGGTVSSSYIVVAKLNSGGQLDASFGTNGLVLQENSLPPNARRVEVELFSDGRVCLATEQEIYPNGFSYPEVAPAVFAYLPNGDVDPDFIQGPRVLSRNITLSLTEELTIEYEDFYPGELRINNNDQVFFSGAVRDDDEQTIDFGSFLLSLQPNGEYNTTIGVNPEFDTLITEERISVPGMISLATSRDDEDYVYSLQFLENGEMLIAGIEYSSDGYFGYVKYLDNTGNPFIEFANQSVFRYQLTPDNFTEGFNSSTFQSNGELVLLSRYTDEQGKLGFYLVRLGENGVLGQNAIAENSRGITLYPNPTNSLVYVNIPGHKSADKIELFDLSGAQISSSINTSTLDVSALSQGLYFVEVESDGLIYRSKIIRN